MKKLLMICQIAVILLGLSSCATILTGNKQVVSFSSEPSGVTVTNNGKYVGVTPFSAKIKKSKSAVFEFSKDSHEKKTVVQAGHFNPTTLLSIVTGLWMVVDFASGAAWKYDNSVFAKLTPYPNQVVSPSSQMASSTVTTPPVHKVTSDVALNIPTTTAKNENTFAVIIANENYQSESQVDFAQNDGETFRKYCIQTLGLPENNVHFALNATLNNIRREINWISSVADAYKGEANIIFYYAGHGIPDERSGSAYLLPVDGYGSDIATGYKLDDLYAQLGAMPAKSITIFMDACFSGAQRSGTMLASARGVAIKASEGKPVGNMIVFSAAQGDETAFPYRDKGHGMFTYFLLKKLQESKGQTTLGELGAYITDNVRKQSIVVNSKSQTPTVTPSASIGEKWKKMSLTTR